MTRGTKTTTEVTTIANPEYPHAPRPSCHAVIRDGGRVLLVKRGGPPFRGYWGLPGGAVELGETVATALVREVREETGLEVAAGRFLDYVDAVSRDDAGRVRYHYVILFFCAELLGGSLAAASDAAEAVWFTPAQLAGLPLVPGAERILALAGVAGR